MKGKHCKLYDENLVFSIMASTGVSVMEYVKKHKAASPDDVYSYVEKNGRRIIEATIEDMNSLGDLPGKYATQDDDPGEDSRGEDEA
jgi:hypothetical protein